MLSDEIHQAQIASAEQMLVDFCVLLPDLYGEFAHLLLLAKYV